MSVAVLACGALAADVRPVALRRGWDVDVHPLPALLHNRPERIAPAVADALRALLDAYDVVAVAYADCGSYGAIDEVVARFGLRRLTGEHCYDVFGREEVAEALDEEPGTYFLTDFLARTFEHTVVRELGLDRHPELREDYFRHYTRVVWLAQRPTRGDARGGSAGGGADRAAAQERAVGNAGLERGLEALLAG